ncbi:MAG: DUF2793 domain-containing protein [Oceanicaulis sp.]
MSDLTPRLGLPWLMPAQAQKHVTVNEALGRLDALVQARAVSRTAADEPAEPEEGDAWILPAAPSGAAWDGFAEHDLVWFQDGAWRRAAPQTGLVAFVEDAAELVVFDGSDWRSLADTLASLANLESLGVGTAPDASNPFAAKLNAALWTARYAAEGGSGDLRYTLNKEAPGGVLSLLMQSNWSGRAEFGLVGGDDVSLRVSPDGTSWTEALSVDRATGAVAIAEAAVSGGSVTGLAELALAEGGALTLGDGLADLVRRDRLGTAAFFDAEAFRLSPVIEASGAIDLSPDDLGRLIVKTGAGAVRLPDGAILPSGWRVRVKNRSGAAVDLDPGASGTVDGAAPGAALSLADGAAAELVHAGANDWESV